MPKYLFVLLYSTSNDKFGKPLPGPCIFRWPANADSDKTGSIVRDVFYLGYIHLHVNIYCA